MGRIAGQRWTVDHWLSRKGLTRASVQEIINREGSWTKAAAALGINRKAFRERVAEFATSPYAEGVGSGVCSQCACPIDHGYTEHRKCKKCMMDGRDKAKLKASGRRAKHKRRALAHGVRVGKDSLSDAVWDILVRETGGVCCYCQRQRTLELEHIRPITKGGPHQMSNLSVACKSCNSSKGNRLLFKEWQPVGPHVCVIEKHKQHACNVNGS